MSRVMLKLDSNLGRAGVEAALELPEASEPDDVDEKVRFRSNPRRTMCKRSSRNFFDDGSVKPVLSYRTSYSLTHDSTATFSYSFIADAKHFYKTITFNTDKYRLFKKAQLTKA